MNSDAHALLRELRSAGLHLRVEEDQLAIKPARLLTPELRERAKTNKAALMALLRGDHWQERADRRKYATSDVEADGGGQVYTPHDPPIIEPSSVDEAALDLMILSFASGRRARMLTALGRCPPELARQIESNLRPVLTAIASARDEPPQEI